jgi:hypothetical protein
MDEFEKRIQANIDGAKYWYDHPERYADLERHDMIRDRYDIEFESYSWALKTYQELKPELEAMIRQDERKKLGARR